MGMCRRQNRFAGGTGGLSDLRPVCRIHSGCRIGGWVQNLGFCRIGRFGKSWGMRYCAGFPIFVGLPIMKDCDLGRVGVGLSRSRRWSGHGADLGHAECLKKGWVGGPFGLEFIFLEANGHYQKVFPLKNLFLDEFV